MTRSTNLVSRNKYTLYVTCGCFSHVWSTHKISQTCELKIYAFPDCIIAVCPDVQANRFKQHQNQNPKHEDDGQLWCRSTPACVQAISVLTDESLPYSLDVGIFSSFCPPYRPRSGQGTGGLGKGVTFIWMCVISSFFDIDSFKMTDASAPPLLPPTPAPTAAPVSTQHTQRDGQAYSGVPIVVPGLIQAEEFDLGGEGLAYHDTTPGNKKGVSLK